jgi:hypothetical protein
VPIEALEGKAAIRRSQAAKPSSGPVEIHGDKLDGSGANRIGESVRVVGAK